MQKGVTTDPFRVWREQQLEARLASAATEIIDVELSARRRAITMIAWCEWRLARLNGREATDLWDRYYTILEQQTALQLVEDYGTIPRSIEACTAIINEAAAIIEQLAAEGIA